MASLVGDLSQHIFGHSDASRTFRPWWIFLEDYILYCMVLLGECRHRKRLWLYSAFFPLFTHKRVVKQLSSTQPLFCWLLKSKHSLIRREHHSLTAHRNIHHTPLISFQNPVAYAICWAVSEVLSNFSSWFLKPVSKKREKNLIQCLSIDCTSIEARSFTIRVS